MSLVDTHPSQWTDPEQCNGYGLTRELADRCNETYQAWLDAGKPSKHGSPEGKAMKAARVAFGDARREWRETQVLALERGGRQATYSKKLGTGASVDIISHYDPETGPITDTPEGEAYWADVQAAVDAGVPNHMGVQR